MNYDFYFKVYYYLLFECSKLKLDFKFDEMVKLEFFSSDQVDEKVQLT